MKFQLAACALATVFAGTAAADVTFQIDPATGEVVIINSDPSATAIAGYDLQVLGGAGTFDTGLFDAPLGGVANESAARIGEITFGAALQLAPGETSLGNVFIAADPGSLSASDFGSEVLADDNVTLIPSNVVVIPEPGSLALLGLGGLALLRRRRSA